MTVPLNELFDVTYGSKLDLNKMAVANRRDEGVNFVGRSSQHHGVSGRVQLPSGLQPFPAGAITVALGGTKLLTSFVQAEPFVTAQNVAVLRERAPMTMAEKLYLCLCIRHNRFRYSAFGREANRTLRTLPVPNRNEFPSWLSSVRLGSLELDFSEPRLQSTTPDINVARWKPYNLSDLFDIKKGKRLTKANARPGNTPFIGAIDSNNGLRQRVSAKPRHPGNTITVNYNGSVAEAFYQAEPFFASDDVNVLYPRFEMSEYIALFICTVIRREKYRFSYGRKWNLDRMMASQISLPALPDGRPDFITMHDFISSLPYSAAVASDLDAELAVVSSGGQDRRNHSRGLLAR